MHLRVALTAVFVTLLTTNVCFSQDVEEAAEGWMKFLQGKWTYSILATGATGDWIVEKTAVKNVLSAKGIDKDGRAFLAGVYVWDKNAETIRMFCGFDNADGVGSFTVELSEIKSDKATGKQGQGSADDDVGYVRIDENTWHVVDGAGDATIKLTR